MNTGTARLALLVALAAVAGAAWAAPPAASFLSPSQYTFRPGDALTLRYEVGPAQAAQPTAWPADEIEWFFVRGGGEQENRHEVRPERADDNFIRVIVPHAGVTVLGTNRTTVLKEVTGDELRAFAEQNLAELPEAAKSLAADRKLRVRHYSSAKTFIRADDGSVEPSAIAARRTGQKVELRPLFDATVAHVGSDLALFAYVDGAKQPGALVRATHVASGKFQTLTTDAEGSGHFRIDATGAWRVEFHKLVPPDGNAGANWVLYTGTLSFEVKGAAQ